MFDIPGMLRAQGIDLRDLKGAGAELRELRADLRAIRASLEGAHGVASADAPAPLASRVPWVRIVDFATAGDGGGVGIGTSSGTTATVASYSNDDGTVYRFDLEAAMGRPSSRGTVDNLLSVDGEFVRFLGVSDEWTEYIALGTPGAHAGRIAWDWGVRAIEVLHTSTFAGRVQVIAR